LKGRLRTGNKYSARSKDANTSFKFDTKWVLVEISKELGEVAEIRSIVVKDDVSVSKGVITIPPVVVAGLPVGVWRQLTYGVRFTKSSCSVEPEDSGFKVAWGTHSRSKLGKSVWVSQEELGVLKGDVAQGISFHLNSVGKCGYVISFARGRNLAFFINEGSRDSVAVFGAIGSVCVGRGFCKLNVGTVSKSPLPRFKLDGVGSLDKSLDMQSSMISSFLLEDMVLVLGSISGN